MATFPTLSSKSDAVIKTVEMHTGGEPLRIIVSGYPALSGATLLEKRRYVRENLDHLRRALMWEPRGHKDMYGALLVEKDADEADLAVLFIHNEGYSTMCGHAMLALGRYAIDTGIVSPVSPETEVKIQCPCGLVPAYVQYSSESGQSGRVRFHSVPAFAVAVNQKIEVGDFGRVVYDIGYGGAFYALVDVYQFNLDLESTAIEVLVKLADNITQAIKHSVPLKHPESDDLAFLYGTILTDGGDAKESSNNICVFADKQVDRSPCGSGVTTRIAVQFSKGQVVLGQEKLFTQPKVGSEMRGKPVSIQTYGDYDKAVVVEVSGMGHYCGQAEYWPEEGDELASGFLVR